MSTRNWLILAAVVLVAYLWYANQKKKMNLPPSSGAPVSGNPVGLQKVKLVPVAA